MFLPLPVRCHTPYGGSPFGRFQCFGTGRTTQLSRAAGTSVSSDGMSTTKMCLDFEKKSLICSRVGHSGVCIWKSVIDWEALHAMVHSSDVWARPEPGTRSFFRSLEWNDSDLAFLPRSGNPGFTSGMATVGISVSPSHLPPPPSWYFRKESCIYYWDFS